MGKGALRNERCECGSGKKVKNCNCKLKLMNQFFPEGTLLTGKNASFKAWTVLTEETYPGLDSLDGEKQWYAPLCSLQQIERIFNPQSGSDVLLKYQVDSVLDNIRISRSFYKRYNCSSSWNIEDEFDKTVFKLFQTILVDTDFYQKFVDIPCGTTYDSDANGQCRKTKYGNIITISAILKDFLFFMNIFYYGISEQTILPNIAYSARCIALRIMLGVEALDFDLDPRGEIPKEIERIVNDNTKWEMMFVVAHEFAHAFLGHLDDKNVIRCATEKGISIIYNQSQKQEFEADIKAIEIIGSVLGVEDAMEMAISFFMSLDLYEQAKEQISPSIVTYKTHPCAEERIRNIVKHFGVNEEKHEEGIRCNNLIKQEIMEDISVNFDRYEFYGSVYLGEWKKRMLKDRVDY